jgi:hypothetical protein
MWIVFIRSVSLVAHDVVYKSTRTRCSFTSDSCLTPTLSSFQLPKGGEMAGWYQENEALVLLCDMNKNTKLTNYMMYLTTIVHVVEAIKIQEITKLFTSVNLPVKLTKKIKLFKSTYVHYPTCAVWSQSPQRLFIICILTSHR